MFCVKDKSAAKSKAIFCINQIFSEIRLSIFLTADYETPLFSFARFGNHAAHSLDVLQEPDLDASLYVALRNCTEVFGVALLLSHQPENLLPAVLGLGHLPALARQRS